MAEALAASWEKSKMADVLKKTDPAPYFMSYAVTDEDYAVVSASFGRAV